jgi:hypothetical protein
VKSKTNPWKTDRVLFWHSLNGPKSVQSKTNPWKTDRVLFWHSLNGQSLCEAKSTRGQTKFCSGTPSMVRVRAPTTCWAMPALTCGIRDTGLGPTLLQSACWARDLRLLTILTPARCARCAKVQRHRCAAAQGTAGDAGAAAGRAAHPHKRVPGPLLAKHSCCQLDLAKRLHRGGPPGPRGQCFPNHLLAVLEKPPPLAAHERRKSHDFRWEV